MGNLPFRTFSVPYSAGCFMSGEYETYHQTNASRILFFPVSNCVSSSCQYSLMPDTRPYEGDYLLSLVEHALARPASILTAVSSLNTIKARLMRRAFSQRNLLQKNYVVTFTSIVFGFAFSDLGR
jgi:hypothetical protein